MKTHTVAVALSGGIDSLVSGKLLKQRYPNIFGLHFITGFEKKRLDTRKLEQQLGFKVITTDLSGCFKTRVVDYFLDTYLAGKTPNPCAICNKAVKFSALFDEARKHGADLLATGHYAGIRPLDENHDPGSGTVCLVKGKDASKDQSYFLALVDPRVLRRTLFPLSGMTKPDVKAFAKSQGLASLTGSESQDICFTGPGGAGAFIRQHAGFQAGSGDIADDLGNIIGRHQGIFRYTVGQRRGINCPAPEPYYVKSIDVRRNRLVVCHKAGLGQKRFTVKRLNWNGPDGNRFYPVTIKIRYGHKGAKGTLTLTGERVQVEFDHPQDAAAPGQLAVFYLKDRVLGGGIIQ